jgi:hypothetical protein
MEYWHHSCSIWLKNNTVDGINNHGETMKIDPKSLDPNTEVVRF